MKQLILQLKNITTQLSEPLGGRILLNKINLEIRKGETVALVGESGSGKTMTALSVLGLLPRNIHLVDGEIHFNHELIANTGGYFGNHLRGTHIAMIFQHPIAALNPVFTIGTQLTDFIKNNLGLNRKAARVKTNEMLNLVGFQNSERIFQLYPHQLSGGMAQRAMIALALSCYPQIIIADEPTTALDVISQMKILQLLKHLQSKFEFALWFISHNIKLVSLMADSVAVMKAGRIVESASARSLLNSPRHIYSKALLNSSGMKTINSTADVVVC